MKENGLPYALFNDLSPNPTSDQVEAGVQVYRQTGCDGIVALGGGSPMDCAKAIGARIARPGRSVSRLQGLLKVGRPLPPLFAIPTTAGTGSETTLAAVITDSGTHRKAAINDPRLMPRYALLDPSLTLDLPPFTTAITGMDALCHAVESYTNRTYCTQKELRLFFFLVSEYVISLNVYFIICLLLCMYHWLWSCNNGILRNVKRNHAVCSNFRSLSNRALS